MVIFGFCLYLAYRDDLFKIAYECDRIIKPKSWLAILDFYNSSEKITAYHHKNGVNSYKMNYAQLFSWHPFYNIVTSKVRHHCKLEEYTDDKDQMIQIALLRKAEL